MYFSFFKLKKWEKRRLRLADAIVRCCLNKTVKNRFIRLLFQQPAAQPQKRKSIHFSPLPAACEGFAG